MRAFELTGQVENIGKLKIRADDGFVVVMFESQIILSGHLKIVKEIFHTLLDDIICGKKIELEEK